MPHVKGWFNMITSFLLSKISGGSRWGVLAGTYFGFQFVNE
jgi:hypothetical protein